MRRISIFGAIVPVCLSLAGCMEPQPCPPWANERLPGDGPVGMDGRPPADAAVRPDGHLFVPDVGAALETGIRRDGRVGLIRDLGLVDANPEPRDDSTLVDSGTEPLADGLVEADAADVGDASQAWDVRDSTDVRNGRDARVLPGVEPVLDASSDGEPEQPDVAWQAAPCFPREPEPRDWAQRTGRRDSDRITYRGQVIRSPETAPRLDIEIQPIAGVAIEARQAGIVYRHPDSDDEPVVRTGSFSSATADGHEVWSLSFNWSDLSRPALFTAWYLDGQGNIFYDDNMGQLHVVTAMPLNHWRANGTRSDYDCLRRRRPALNLLIPETLSPAANADRFADGGFRGTFEISAPDLGFESEVVLIWSADGGGTTTASPMHCLGQIAPDRQRWGLDLEVPHATGLDFQVLYRHGIADGARPYALRMGPFGMDRPGPETCEAGHDALDWAQAEGERDQHRIAYSGVAPIEPQVCGPEPGSPCEGPFMIVSLRVEPTPEADPATRRVGIIRRRFHTARHETLAAEWVADRDDGFEEWQVRVAHDAETYTPFVFTAWYFDGRETLYDDNQGHLHLSPNTSIFGVLRDRGFGGDQDAFTVDFTAPFYQGDGHLLWSTDDWATSTRVDSQSCEPAEGAEDAVLMRYKSWHFELPMPQPNAQRIDIVGVYEHPSSDGARPYELRTRPYRLAANGHPCQPESLWADWAQQQGRRDTNVIHYLHPEALGIEHPAEGPAQIVIDLLVASNGGAEVGQREVGIVSRTTYYGPQQTLPAAFETRREDGGEIWRVRVPIYPYVAQAFAFTAWHRNDGGEIHYDDNAGELHAIAHRPDMRLIGRPGHESITIDDDGVHGEINGEFTLLSFHYEIVAVWTTDGWQSSHETIASRCVGRQHPSSWFGITIDTDAITDRFEYFLVYRHGIAEGARQYDLNHQAHDGPYVITRDL